ncbi:hypothetical protein [Paenibacillus hunanensis]|nr:hypothetical protein [Paenibacillus hunanensis]
MNRNWQLNEQKPIKAVSNEDELGGKLVQLQVVQSNEAIIEECGTQAL